MKQDDEESLKAVVPDVIKIDQLQHNLKEMEIKSSRQQAGLSGLGKDILDRVQCPDAKTSTYRQLGRCVASTYRQLERCVTSTTGS